MIQAVTQWDHSDGDVFPVFSHNIFEYREECSFFLGGMDCNSFNTTSPYIIVDLFGFSRSWWRQDLESLLQAIIKAQDEGPHPTCLPVATVGVSSISWTVGLGDKIDMSD